MEGSITGPMVSLSTRCLAGAAIRRMILLTVLVYGLVAIPAAAAGPPPPSLATGGEILTSNEVPGPGTRVKCQTAGGGKATTDSTGTADGAYPGPFTAHISARLSPTGLQMKERFTITSTSGPTAGDRVTGTESTSNANTANALCDASSPFGIIGQDRFSAFGGGVPYDATITTPTSGSYEDSGGSNFLLVAFPTTEGPTGTQDGMQFFSEMFATSNGVVPVWPSRVQCMDEGRHSDRQFNYRGDCVSYAEPGD
jgi:hypothetical protein